MVDPFSKFIRRASLTSLKALIHGYFRGGDSILLRCQYGLPSGLFW